VLLLPCRKSEQGISCEAKRAVFEILGIAGITISMLAYVPQVVHLGKEQCSAGISRRAWAMWLVASLLVGAVAVHRGDLVFIALQLSTMTRPPSSSSWRRSTAGECARLTRPTRQVSSRRLVACRQGKQERVRRHPA
jgi:uncharacterized protein with PQ loop repeat